MAAVTPENVAWIVDSQTRDLTGNPTTIRVSKDNLEKRFNFVFDDYFKTELMRLNELERDELIEGRTARNIRVTPTGRIFIRAVAKVFDAFQPSAPEPASHP